LFGFAAELDNDIPGNPAALSAHESWLEDISSQTALSLILPINELEALKIS